MSSDKLPMFLKTLTQINRSKQTRTTHQSHQTVNKQLQIKRPRQCQRWWWWSNNVYVRARTIVVSCSHFVSFPNRGWVSGIASSLFMNFIFRFRLASSDFFVCLYSHFSQLVCSIFHLLPFRLYSRWYWSTPFCCFILCLFACGFSSGLIELRLDVAGSY